MPTHTDGSWVGWDADRYAVYYPVAGRLARVDATSTAGLGPLVGANRAEVLVLLDVPRSTSQLATLSGQALGSVGGHLKVLLEAGVVLRRRSGREVLYWRTRSATRWSAARSAEGGGPAAPSGWCRSPRRPGPARPCAR